MLLLSTLLTALIINFLLFLIAYRRQSDKLTDFAYALSFIVVVITAFTVSQHRTAVSVAASLAVLVWALRLGGFLVYRIRKTGKDKRFDDIRRDFTKFLKFWLGQGLVAWVLLLPLLFASSSPAGNISWLFWLGLIVWLAGWLTELVADAQKFRFKQRADSQGKWIDEGLWHYSRHPNYFGEITIWIGIYLTVFVSLSPLERLVGLISPLAIAISLLFISGIPPLEKYADAKWGKDKDYRAYKRRTSLLIPLWPRK
ncbi:MAG TPA: DUF1295 domain-containing protein [Candidatus Saccharimonadales bacterium]|nr:DUF1295 domain-containing protein [Candidatus Saccharimonadales bacterium]